jgi:hypothetical protein
MTLGNMRVIGGGISAGGGCRRMWVFGSPPPSL